MYKSTQIHTYWCLVGLCCCSYFEIASCSIAQTDLRLIVNLLPQPSEIQDRNMHSLLTEETSLKCPYSSNVHHGLGGSSADPQYLVCLVHSHQNIWTEALSSCLPVFLWHPTHRYNFMNSFWVRKWMNEWTNDDCNWSDHYQQLQFHHCRGSLWVGE